MATRKYLPLIAVCGLMMLTGCSSMSVWTDYGEGVDFSEFETFHYRDSDTNLSGSSPLAISESLRPSNARWQLRA